MSKFFLFHTDMEDPSFGDTCPPARTVFADKGKTSATVSWGPVTTTDNDQAIVTVSPQVMSPHIFSEGNHTVVYTATDPSGNTKHSASSTLPCKVRTKLLAGTYNVGSIVKVRVLLLTSSSSPYVFCKRRD